MLRVISCSGPTGTAIHSGYRSESARVVQSRQVPSLAAVSASQFLVTGVWMQIRGGGRMRPPLRDLQLAHLSQELAIGACFG